MQSEPTVVEFDSKTPSGPLTSTPYYRESNCVQPLPLFQPPLIFSTMKEKKEDARKIFNQKESSDVVIVSKDGKHIYCHTDFLRKQSTYFESNTDFRKSKGSEFHMNLGGKILTELLRFIYTEEAFIEDWNLRELLSLMLASKEFQVPRLIDKCSTLVVKDHLKDGKLGKMYETAEKCDTPSLMDAIVDFCTKNIASVVKEVEDFKTFPAKLLVALLERKSFERKPGFSNAIESWMLNHSAAETATVLEKLHWDIFDQKQMATIIKKLLSVITERTESKENCVQMIQRLVQVLKGTTGVTISGLFESVQLENESILERENINHIWSTFYYKNLDSYDHLLTNSEEFLLIPGKAEGSCLSIFLKSELNVSKVRWSAKKLTVFKVWVAVEGRWHEDFVPQSVGKEFEVTINKKHVKVVRLYYKKELQIKNLRFY